MPAPFGGILDRLSGVTGGIDWSGVAAVALTGLLVGGIAFSVAVAVAYWIRHTEAAAGASGTASAVASHGLRRFRKARGVEDAGRWLCGSCRSWNPPGSDHCYRGCGRRADVRLLLPGEVERPAPAPGEPGDPEASDGSDDPHDPA